MHPSGDGSTVEGAKDPHEEEPGQKAARGRPVRRLDPNLEPEVLAFAEELRRGVFEPVKNRDIALSEFSEQLTGVFGLDSGYSESTLQRIQAGRRVPTREVLDGIFYQAGVLAGNPMQPAARQHLLALYYTALRCTDRGLYDFYLLIEERDAYSQLCEQLRTEQEELARQQEQAEADLAATREQLDRAQAAATAAELDKRQLLIQAAGERALLVGQREQAQMRCAELTAQREADQQELARLSTQAQIAQRGLAGAERRLHALYAERDQLARERTAHQTTNQAVAEAETVVNDALLSMRDQLTTRHLAPTPAAGGDGKDSDPGRNPEYQAKPPTVPPGTPAATAALARELAMANQAEQLRTLLGGFAERPPGEVAELIRCLYTVALQREAEILHDFMPPQALHQLNNILRSMGIPALTGTNRSAAQDPGAPFEGNGFGAEHPGAAPGQTSAPAADSAEPPMDENPSECPCGDALVTALRAHRSPAEQDRLLLDASRQHSAQMIADDIVALDAVSLPQEEALIVHSLPHTEADTVLGEAMLALRSQHGTTDTNTLPAGPYLQVLYVLAQSADALQLRMLLPYLDKDGLAWITRFVAANRRVPDIVPMLTEKSRLYTALRRQISRLPRKERRILKAQLKEAGVEGI